MLNPHHILLHDSATRHLFDELGKILHARRLSVVLADAATQGFFAFAASQHLVIRSFLETSLVVNTAHSLKSVLGVDIQGQSMDQLSPAVGVEMARNALELSQASLAIAMTQCPAKHLALPNCTVLGLHWWYKDRCNGDSSWMLSHQFVVACPREELPGKLLQVAAHETIKVLRLQEPSPA